MHREPVEESQSNDPASRGTETTERVGEVHIVEMEGKVSCNGGRRDLSKPEVHQRRNETELEKAKMEWTKYERAGTEYTKKPRWRRTEKELKKVVIGRQLLHSQDQEREQ